MLKFLWRNLPSWMGRRFARDRHANVTMIFAVSAIPLFFAFGMGSDYVIASRKRESLNALADSATLLATSQSMLPKSAAQAQAQALNFFLSQAAALKGVVLDPANVQLSVTDQSAGTVTLRTATLNYKAESPNNFSGILHLADLAIAGASTASSSGAPNIDFYMMLDSSPSMEIPATTAGINTMIAKTPKQDDNGCAFACHETNPAAADVTGNPHGEDNYALARSLGITLRIDLVGTAVQTLISNASTMANAFHAQYRMATYSFDTSLHNLGALTSNLTTAQSQAATLQPMVIYSNNYPPNMVYNQDEDSNWDGAITGMNSAIPTPGNGTNNAGDTPQAVLMIVTDGVADEGVPDKSVTAMGGPTCTAIKNRGIRIAILYTTYFPIPIDYTYQQYVQPIQPNIGTSLQACASPGLYNSVSTDGDITAALAALFNKTLTSAHLTQ